MSYRFACGLSLASCPSSLFLPLITQSAEPTCREDERSLETKSSLHLGWLRADMVSVHIRYLTPYPIPIDPVQTYPQRHEAIR